MNIGTLKIVNRGIKMNKKEFFKTLKSSLFFIFILSLSMIFEFSDNLSLEFIKKIILDGIKWFPFAFLVMIIAFYLSRRS